MGRSILAIFISINWTISTGADRGIARRSGGAGAVSEQWRQPTSIFMSPTDPHQQLRVALEEALGGGHGVPEEQMRSIQEQLWPTWKSLPKTSNGNVDRPSLCHVVHRFFKQTYGIIIAGLDPHAAYKNEEELELLAVFAPDYVHTVLRGETASEGFSIEDGVAMVVVIEHLIAESVHELLTDIISRHSAKEEVGRETFIQLLEAWLGRWMSIVTGVPGSVRDDQEIFRQLAADRPSLAQIVPGRVKTLEYFRDSDVRHSRDARAGRHAMQRSFSLEDAKIVSLDIAKQLGPYWQSECQKMSDKLAKWDTGNTGRVPISKFYQAALAGEWRFTESLPYLEQQGAVDNSSSWHGPRVIIANYIEARSNCVVMQQHYSVCCQSQCEGYLDALEEAVGDPSATPELLLVLVGDLLSAETDDELELSATLRAQLRSIADVRTGKVWLHGRLFAQWLHFVFPYDCPFPHLTGKAKAMTPLEFGPNSIAKRLDMVSLAKLADRRRQKNATHGEDWMTLWSHEEELVAEDVYLHAPWETKAPQSLVAAFGLLLVLVALLGAKHGLASTSSKEVSARILHEVKEHII
mmetsp:Transcript_5088/g.11809  ORF Transcript_5088/g.11809 Transcript_5088/m.11809 type:complete len:579 (-) Transcript_5088:50-1786(-)